MNVRSKKHLLHIQQKWYLHNVTMNISPIYIIHGYNLITGKKIKLGILDNKLRNLQNFNLYVLCNLITLEEKHVFSTSLCD
jgi:hypothetical protein